MNVKKFILASIVVFVVYQVLNFIIHGLILDSVYESMAGVWREDMDSTMWIMYVTSFIMSFLFVFIFIKGYEGKGIAEGLRFGLWIGLLMNVVGMFNQYAVYPISMSLTIQWFVYGVIQLMICGIFAAWLYKPE